MWRVIELGKGVAEHFFAINNQRLRRRVGRKHLGHDLDQQPAQAALALNLKQRAMLAGQLLQSLDEISEEEAEELWLDEAERRIREYTAGRSESISAETVIHEAREQIS